MTPKKRRGLSPAITMLILLGISVIAGVAVYQNFQNQSSVAGVRASVTVQNMALLKDPSGDLWFSATIKNSGNRQIESTSINLQVDVDSATPGVQPFSTSPSPALLDPGQTASVFVRLEDAGGNPIRTIQVGKTVPVEVRGVTPDGSVLTVPTSVMAGLA